MKNNLSRDVICVSPKAIHKGKRLIEIIIDHAHNIIGHFGQFKTSQYIRRYFWWQSMSHDIESYYKTCGTCTTSKDTNSKPTGLLHSLVIEPFTRRQLENTITGKMWSEAAKHAAVKQVMRPPPCPPKAVESTTAPLSSEFDQYTLLARLSDAEAQAKPFDNAMVVDEPVKPVAGSSKHPDNADIIDSELIY